MSETLQRRNHHFGSLTVPSNLANTASLLWHAYKSLSAPSNEVNWAGFYVRDVAAPSLLILGPFQGKVACQTISFGRGVCGCAASTRETQLVKDVDAFPGHIACDGVCHSFLLNALFQREGLIIECCGAGFEERDRCARAPQREGSGYH